mmetsp:Transcript_16979/g.41381  ORF Transcript_16979/g.41381 Transcript_16979/m.41381 type:complete len:571 (-) Transcript_16979:95-1807(-)
MVDIKLLSRSVCLILFQLVQTDALIANRCNEGFTMLSKERWSQECFKFSLAARSWRSYDDGYERDDDTARQRSVDRPTKTAFDEFGPEISPQKPKIVVLGATGRVGRHVVRQLLETGGKDMTIVALVRDYDKAIKLFYDDCIFARKGPSLQIVQGNLVPREELPGFSEQDPNEEVFFQQKAESAAKFYGTNVSEYDNREMLPSLNEALESCIVDATTIISCVGSVRPTNLWHDVLARPLWRLLRSDVSKWCKDPKHPYYTNYLSTRKALTLAEREQRKREAAVMALVEDDEKNKDPVVVPKIRFIRISDLCVGQKPWNFVPLVTNMMQSVVFRYQEMAERMLDQSTLLETIILRPGDLVDEERDVNTTTLQVSASGVVPNPARVGREDVAALAVAAASFSNERNETALEGPFHYTLGVRWVGEDMAPYPSQGRKHDGLPDARLALKRTIETISKAKERTRRRKQLVAQKQSPPRQRANDIIERIRSQQSKRLGRIQPHGICVAVPTYFFVMLAAKTVLYPMVQVLPGGRTVLLPGLRRLNQTVISAIWGFLLAIMRNLLPLARRRRYISF